MGNWFSKPDDEDEETKSKEPQKDEHFDHWGLGLGIDITKPRPWLQKSSFQVRSVKAGEIIETDHGGFLHGYKEEIHSTAALHLEAKAGVKMPLDVPLNLGLGAEYTRTTISSKTIRGTKVKNRTLSFRMDFDDVPLPLLPPEKTASNGTEQGGEVQDSTPKDTTGSDRPFEHTDDFDQSQPEKTASNGTEQSSQPHGDEETGETEPAKKEVQSSIPQESDRPFETRLRDWLTECCENREHNSQTNDRHQLQTDVKHFVKSVGITHYISAVELGAYEYRKVSKKERDVQKGAGANVSLDALTYGAIETSANVKSTKKRSKEKSEQLKLGRITRDKSKKWHVTKKNEAMIGYQVVPISTLVKNPYLHEALRSSVEDYIKSQAKDHGPYLITCSDGINDPVYLNVVDKQNKKCLSATSKKEDAEKFMVKVFDDYHHDFEFAITTTLEVYKRNQQGNSEGMQPQAQDGTSHPVESHNAHASAAVGASHEPLASAAVGASHEPLASASVGQKNCHQRMVPLEWYLERHVNCFGNGCELKVCMTPKLRHTRMVLKERIDYKTSVDVQQWLEGRDAYYISCVKRFRDGFLCVNELENESYEVRVKRSHHFQYKTFKVFRLQCV